MDFSDSESLNPTGCRLSCSSTFLALTICVLRFIDADPDADSSRTPALPADADRLGVFLLELAKVFHLDE